MTVSSPLRVRFAPSPTGYLHVGGARTLLFNWLFAKKFGGKLILRIEDTDQVRSTLEFEKMVIEDIRNLGFDYDESPDHPGQVGPYRQSDRLGIYAEHVKKLLDTDQAYYCFCSDELLTTKREAALKLEKSPHYDGTCAQIPKNESLTRLEKGEKAGVRFRTLHKNYSLKDLVKGSVEFRDGMVGDFFITRTPTENEKALANHIGMPVYNFCCVIDDHLMGISHVIRGEDHLSNTARQLMIYDAFGWTTPVFAHIATVLGTDRQKLSKRSGDVSVHEYLEKGYLPEALINFLSLLGWWPGSDLKPVSGHPEIISKEELIAHFDTSGLQKSPGVFDVQKLNWMNAQYIKHLPMDALAQLSRRFFVPFEPVLHKKGDEWFKKVLETVKDKVQLLSELPQATDIFFETSASLEDAARAVLIDPSVKAVIDELSLKLQGLSETIEGHEVDLMQKQISLTTGAKGKALFMPIRAAITGRVHGADLNKILPLMGKTVVLERVAQIRKQII